MTKHATLTWTLPVLLLAGCHSAPPAPASQSPIAAAVIAVSSTARNGQITLPGIVKPRLETDLAAQLTAPITSITKREGDYVRRGEVLVRLHTPALQANVAQANAALAGAQRQQSAAETQSKLAADTLSRYQQLREHHSVTPYELDQMQAQSAAAKAQQQAAASQVVAAQATLAAQQANAADAVLYAPFDGVITRHLADPGTVALPGVPILHLQSTGQQDVDLSLPADALASIHLGSTLPVTAAVSTAPVLATITNISPAGDPASHSFLVKASLPAKTPWPAGSVVNVLLPSTKTQPSTTIPVSALIQQGGLDAVLILDAASHAELRYVTLGNRLNNSVEVLTGLRSGDRILLHGDLNLAGHAIRPTEVQP